MHNKTAASRYYVQNIIGAPRHDPHTPPENPVNNSPVTNCLTETVGVENNVVYIQRDGRHWRCTFIGECRVTECLKEVVWVETGEVEIGNVHVSGLHGYRGCLRQSGRLEGSNNSLYRFEPTKWSLVGMSRDAHNTLLTTQRLEKTERATAIKVYLGEADNPWWDQDR